MRRWFVSLFTVVGALISFAVPGVAQADDIRKQEWHLDYLKVNQAHDVSQGVGVTVAVIDSGVDSSHPDLTGSVLNGTVLIDGQSGDGRQDINGHGTAMAGLVAAHGRGPDGGILGIAPAAKILPIRIAFGFSKDVNADEVRRAIDFAVAQHARVINISAGGSDTDTLRTAVSRALAADVMVVASIGNTSGGLDVMAPALYPGVLAVAATDRAGRRASFSIAAPQVGIAAPGVDIMTAGLNKGYRTGSGTSEATAIVAGAAALIRSRYPDMPATEVIHRLTATATDAGAPGRDDEYGYGILNLVDALTKDVPPLGSSATPSPTTTQSHAPEAGRRNPSAGVLVGVLLLILLAAAGAWLAIRGRQA